MNTKQCVSLAQHSSWDQAKQHLHFDVCVLINFSVFVFVASCCCSGEIFQGLTNDHLHFELCSIGFTWVFGCNEAICTLHTAPIFENLLK